MWQSSLHGHCIVSPPLPPRSINSSSPNAFSPRSNPSQSPRGKAHGAVEAHSPQPNQAFSPGREEYEYDESDDRRREQDYGDVSTGYFTAIQMRRNQQGEGVFGNKFRKSSNDVTAAAAAARTRETTRETTAANAAGFQTSAAPMEEYAKTSMSAFRRGRSSWFGAVSSSLPLLFSDQTKTTTTRRSEEKRNSRSAGLTERAYAHGQAMGCSSITLGEGVGGVTSSFAEVSPRDFYRNSLTGPSIIKFLNDRLNLTHAIHRNVRPATALVENTSAAPVLLGAPSSRKRPTCRPSTA